jgi:flagellin
MAASRQIGVTQQGLKQAIERLTTGKRVNRASDDAAAMSAGTTAEASARSSAAQVKAQQAAYFQVQSADAFLNEATNLSYRLAELEGSGNTSSAEYTSVQTLIANAWTAASNALAVTVAGTAVGTMSVATYAATNAAGTLAAIQTERVTQAASMATYNSTANIKGITSENQFSVSDTWLGADIGAETVNLTKYQIMMQAGTSALTQANQSSQSVLALFR